ncbi:S8 family serine peptidase [Microbacterium sp. P05]|uniref:S8 family serine peptidase n=1 Tax=Microbacterium sp. P05 TaxID=3366948 RepID=UPI003745138C
MNTNRLRQLLRRSGAAATALVLTTAIGVVAAPGAFAAATVTPAAASAAASAFTDGRYIVTLRDDAVAAYTGGVSAFDATQPAEGDELDMSSRRVADYSDYLTERQRSVAGSVNASITSSYTVTTNGFASVLTASQAKALSRDPRVAAVVPDELLHLQATPSTEFLGLTGDDGVWAATGGVESAGEGIVVGIIDSGISPENASFAGAPLGTTAGDQPYLDGDTVVFHKADGTAFHGECITGPGFTAADCSTKLITARYFVDSYTPGAVGEHDYLSPRDGSGHGSHTSSTAAGDTGVAAEVAGRDFGRISGVVPGAKLAMYKACWSGATHDDDGCQTGDLLAAIDAAVADGVDVINYSIGGGAAQTTVSLTGEAFLNAAAVGIFVSASAGNDGAGASTADNAAPWITTVAATTIPSYEATVRLGDGRTFLGGSITVPQGAPVTGTLVDAAAVAAADADDPALCAPGSLDPAKTAGRIVLCDRGVVDRTLKTEEVKRAGGIGVVMVNPTSSSVDLDAHVLPTVHVDSFAYDALHAYAATSGATVSLEDGNPDGLPSAQTPQVAGFSSRGPILADGGDVLKPDISAPGVAILAAYASEPGAPGNYALLSGTSMASPHVAGLAALYLGEHPDASPSEIKSAMMTTAYDTVDADGDPATDPFAQGAGHVDPTRYFDPGMLYLNGTEDWYGYIESVEGVDLGVDAVDPSQLNLASISVGGLAGTETITRTVTATRAGTWTAEAPTLDGVTAVVSPSTLTFAAAGEQQQYTVTFTRTDAPVDIFVTGQLIWHDGSDRAVTPIAVRPVSLDVPDAVAGVGANGSLDIPVSVGATSDFAIAKTGLVKGQVMRGSGTAGPVTEPVRSDRWVIDVPDGTTLAHFVLEGVDPKADLDLHLSSFDSAQQLIPWADSATSSSHEVIDYAGLPTNRYVLDVDFFSGVGPLDYTLTSYVLGSSTNDGALTVTPETLHTTLGEPASVAVSWSDLAPGSYYGTVGFGDTGHRTALEIAVPGEVVAPTAPLSLGFDRDWARPGTWIETDVAGLAPGAAYTVSLDGVAPLTGTVGPDGTAERGLSLPEELPEGDYPVTLASGSATVVRTLHVSQLVVFRALENIAFDDAGRATVAIDMDYAGTGELGLTVHGPAGVAFTGSFPVDLADDMYTDTKRTDWLSLAPGVYTAELTGTTSGGPAGQVVEHEFVVPSSEASDVSIVQNPVDPNLADLSYVNRSSTSASLVLRYKLCAGPIVDAGLLVKVINGETFTHTFDMNGKASVELVRDDGTVVAGYINHAADRCAADPVITEDYWVTFSDQPSATPGEEPVSMVFSNRYPAYSGGFEFRAGFGSDIEGPYFDLQKIGHEVVTEVGPVVDVPLRVPEGAAIWTRATYESYDGDVLKLGIRWVKAQGVTLDMLQPVADAGPPADPGTPDGPGTPGDPGDGSSGVGGGPGDGGTDAGSGGDLAATGWEPLPLAGAALLMLVLGGAFRLLRRRAHQNGA